MDLELTAPHAGGTGGAPGYPHLYSKQGSQQRPYDEVTVSPLAPQSNGDCRASDFDVVNIYPANRNSSEFVDDVKIPEQSLVPNIWTKDYIGLYCCYAIFGLILGGSGTWIPFCEYVYKGSSNLCANTGNIGFFAWNFKVFIAVVTDIYRPFGYRRKSWMLMGLSVTLALTFVLAVVPPAAMGANVWISIQFFIQIGVMFSDVPADGYSVELGQLESLEQRGQILVVGQKIQYVFCIVAGLIQTFMLNGTSTNGKDCSIDFEDCWSWGLTVNQYNGLMFALIFVLVIPVLFLKEIEHQDVPHRDGVQFLQDLWDTMQNLATMRLTIYVLGISMLTYTYSNVNLYIQYYIIELTNFQVGIDTTATYFGTWLATFLFQTYLIKKNWRWTQYFATYLQVFLGLLWIPVYYNSGGLRNPWFTIFVDFDSVS
jgi:MFS family permease